MCARACACVCVCVCVCVCTLDRGHSLIPKESINLSPSQSVSLDSLWWNILWKLWALLLVNVSSDLNSYHRSHPSITLSQNTSCHPNINLLSFVTTINSVIAIHVLSINPLCVMYEWSVVSKQCTLCNNVIVLYSQRKDHPLYKVTFEKGVYCVDETYNQSVGDHATFDLFLFMQINCIWDFMLQPIRLALNNNFDYADWDCDFVCIDLEWELCRVWN